MSPPLPAGARRAALALVTRGCLAAPAGPAPLRYRDLVFDDAVMTADLTYAETTTRVGAPITLGADLYAGAGDTAVERPAIIWCTAADSSPAFSTRPRLRSSTRPPPSPGRATSASPSTTARRRPGACSPAVRRVSAASRSTTPWSTCSGGALGSGPTRGVRRRPAPDRHRRSSAGAITVLDVAFNGDTPTPGPLPQSRRGASRSGSRDRDPGERDRPGDAPTLQFHGTADPLVRTRRPWPPTKRPAPASTPLRRPWTARGTRPRLADHRQQILPTPRRTSSLGTPPRPLTPGPRSSLEQRGDELLGSKTDEVVGRLADARRASPGCRARPRSRARCRPWRCRRAW